METRSSDASCSRPSEVIGSTEMPSSSIRNGYSLVPCARAAVLDHAQPPGRDLVVDAVVEQDHAVGDVLLQALPGQRPVAALAGDDGRDPLVLQPAEQPPQLGAQDGLVGQAGEERLERVEDDPLGADRVDRVAEADEQPLEVVLAGLLDLAPVDLDVIDDELLLGDELGRGRSRGSGRSAASSSAVSSKAMKTPGSPNSAAPRTRNSMPKSVLPQPAPPQTSVGRPRGSPPPVISSRPGMPVGRLRQFAR